MFGKPAVGNKDSTKLRLDCLIALMHIIRISGAGLSADVFWCVYCVQLVIATYTTLIKSYQRKIRRPELNSVFALIMFILISG